VRETAAVKHYSTIYFVYILFTQAAGGLDGMFGMVIIPDFPTTLDP
jgi:hypothetical protein